MVGTTYAFLLGCRPISDLVRKPLMPPAGPIGADPPAVAAIEEDVDNNPTEPPRSPTRDDVDLDGRPVWSSLSWVPHMYYPETPVFLFWHDHQENPKWIEAVVVSHMPDPGELMKLMGRDNGQGVNQPFEAGELKSRYHAWTEQEKAPHGARSERLRREVWDERAQYKELKRRRGGGDKQKRPSAPTPATKATTRGGSPWVAPDSFHQVHHQHPEQEQERARRLLAARNPRRPR